MSSSELCTSIGKSLPALFECSPAAQEGVRVRTPLLYPDGGVVDVFVLERNGRYIVTDFGDALGWLRMQSVSVRRSQKQQLLIDDVCQTLGIEFQQRPADPPFGWRRRARRNRPPAGSSGRSGLRPLVHDAC